MVFSSGDEFAESSDELGVNTLFLFVSECFLWTFTWFINEFKSESIKLQ